MRISETKGAFHISMCREERREVMANPFQFPPLHTRILMRRTSANRVFAIFYSFAILALLYHHLIDLLHSTNILSLFILLAEVLFSFLWATSQAFHMYPTDRWVFIEHLEHYAKESDYPGLDVLICTADPHKEPPMCVVNTALSVMAYDYPTEKLSVYISDDGGSKLTLFAFMEAARFATHWLPFCRKNKVVERCPEAYFGSNPSSWFPETDQIKLMYETMKIKVQSVVEKGTIPHDHITNEQEKQAFSRWTDEFTQEKHPAVVQVLLEGGKDMDITGHIMPNLVYVSREKSPRSPKHFKAGALNVLIRVSATMTNAPVVLTLDADMYSNDPQTPLRALCYLLDPDMDPTLGFVQFPQAFHGINEDDIYAGENKHLYQIHSIGLDGLAGPIHVGTGCFFRREVFSGGPSRTAGLSPDRLTGKSISNKEVLALAHHVAAWNYENQTNWGTKMGYRYGSLVEDFYTSYLLHCDGWKSIFCNPNRPAFLGRSPINLNNSLNQARRWGVGLLEVGFCKHSPIVFGVMQIGPLMGLCYANYTFRPLWSIPLTVYAFLPQLALLKGVSIFPKVSEPRFFLYIFLFVGAYTQDCLDFILSGGTIQRWWSSQRVWMMRGVSSYAFSLVEYFLKSIGISQFGFIVTSKVVEEEQSKRYKQGIFEFGVSSPLFLPLTTAAIINLVSFLWGMVLVYKEKNPGGLFLQMFLAGFVMVNCWPIYEAMVLRTDRGRMPTRTTIISIFLAWVLYIIVSVTPKI